MVVGRRRRVEDRDGFVRIILEIVVKENEYIPKCSSSGNIARIQLKRARRGGFDTGKRTEPRGLEVFDVPAQKRTVYPGPRHRRMNRAHIRKDRNVENLRAFIA